MLSAIDRPILLGFLSLMFVVNAVMLFVARTAVTAGANDFPIFYSNAQMVSEGQAAGLYNYDAENRFIRRVSKVMRPPNNHLPYELLLFVPLTYLPFGTACIVWMVLGLGMLAGVAFFMKDRHRNGPGFLVTFLVILAFFPVWYCLLQGQDSILLLFLFAASFGLWGRGHDGLAGFVLALGLFRPQLVLPFALVALVAGKWKFAFGFIPGAVLVGALSVSVVGPQGVADYGRILISQGTQQSARALLDQWEIQPELMATWRGFLWICLPASMPVGFQRFMLLAGTLAGLLWASKKMRAGGDPAAFKMEFAVAVATVVLVSFHSFLNDFSLMILPLLIFGKAVACAPSIPRRSMYWIVMVGLLLFSTPLYLLMLGTGTVGLIATVGFLMLWMASGWSRWSPAISRSDGRCCSGPGRLGV
jgi:hypothetical protein